MARFETWFSVNLNKAPQVQTIHGNVFTQDNMGNLVGVRVMKGNAEATLTGTVLGYVIREDGKTVVVNGERNGNTAYILLPESAYAVPGRIQIAIRLISGSTKTVLLAAIAYVTRTTTGTIIDPGEVIPSLEELLAKLDDMDDAIAAAEQATSDAQDAADELNNGMDSIIKTQDTQPTEPLNKVWVDTGTTVLKTLPEVKDNEISAVDTWSSQKINAELKSALSTDINAVGAVTIGGIFEALTGYYYDLNTGKPVAGSTYTGYKKLFGTDFTAIISNFALFTNRDFISLWKDGTYAGYFFQHEYHLPDRSVVSSIEYDSFAVNVGSRSSYVPTVDPLSNKIDDLENATEPLNVDFKWAAQGCYQYGNGIIKVLNSYHCTEKQNSDEAKLAYPNVLATNDFYSLWNDGAYVGYFLRGKYYNPSQEEVSSLVYDQWALNVWGSRTDYESYKPVSYESRITALESQSHDAGRYNHLNDLKIGFLGDSITKGVGASDPSKCYVALMDAEFGTVTNYGVSGTLIAEETGYSNPMVDRYVNMSNDLDVVVVYGGTNDWYYGTAWGTVDSVDKTTFLGALNVLMSGLVEKYCGKQIFFVTPMSSEYANKNTDNPNACGKTMLDYRNAIIERAMYHAIPVIDLYAMCGMDVAHNAANKTYYSADGVHPNDAGHKRVHDRIVTFISNILY